MNIDIVRPIAEQLIAGGASVWLDEYELPISLQNLPPKLLVEKAEEQICQAIPQAKFGICFTSRGYMRSEICCKELKLLLDSGPQRVIEIRLEDDPLPQAKYQCLPLSSPTPYDPKKPEETLRHIQTKTQLPKGLVEFPVLAETLDTPSFEDPIIGYGINTRGWRKVYRGLGSKLTPAGFIGPAFKRKLGQYDILFHVSMGISAIARTAATQTTEEEKRSIKRTVELEAKRFSQLPNLPSARWVERAVELEAKYPSNQVNLSRDPSCIKRALEFATKYPSEKPTKNESDRERFNDIGKFADTFVTEIGRPCVGVHLFFFGFDGKQSHIAITYASPGGWNRRYSIVLLDPLTRWTVEFAIVFKFVGPFREYCRYAFIMDDLVSSLHTPTGI